MSVRTFLLIRVRIFRLFIRLTAVEFISRRQAKSTLFIRLSAKNFSARIVSLCVYPDDEQDERLFRQKKPGLMKYPERRNKILTEYRQFVDVVAPSLQAAWGWDRKCANAHPD